MSNWRETCLDGNSLDTEIQDKMFASLWEVKVKWALKRTTLKPERKLIRKMLMLKARC